MNNLVVLFSMHENISGPSFQPVRIQKTMPS
jgi:hypothetical protein